jgi:hypothetical protein
MMAEPNPACAYSKPATSDPQVITSVLKRWEQATLTVPEMIRSQREEFRRRLHNEFNQHTAEAVELLVGRVEVRVLIDLFEWQVAETDVERVCLVATPKDLTERLFYGSLRVSLNTATGIADKIVVVGRNQSARIVWQADGERQNKQVQLVQYEDVVPPAPTETLKAVSLRFDGQK